MSSPDTAAREEGRADRAMMALDAEADRWLAETPEFREAIRSIANCMRGPFKDRAAAQIDAIVRHTFIEAYYRGFNAHKDGAALRSTPDPAQGADRSGAGGAEGMVPDGRVADATGPSPFGKNPPVSAPAGVSVPRAPAEPSPGLLMSMALRYDHGFAVPGYYDQPLFGGKPGEHARRLASTLSTMRQLWEEVVGEGFYSPEREADYVARLAKSKGGADVR